MKRKAFATWEGGLMDGRGTITSESGAFNEIPYGFATRFGEDKGTNPEEFIGAALASCFSMALSHELERANIGTGVLRTDVTVDLEKLDEGWSVTHVLLHVEANIPAADPTKFREAAERAKKNCPMAKLFNTRISLEARLAPPLAEAG